MTPSILVLANQADAAEPTARCAAALGGELPAHLVLLHLDMYPVILDPEMMMAATEQTTRQEAATMADLHELAQRLPVPANVIEAAGLMGEAVAAVLRQQNPLLLAMGLQAEHNLLDGLLLNQVLPVLRETHRPLLLVPKAAAAAAGPPRRVVLALDGEPFLLNAAALALAPLLASWPAAYTVAHVATDPTPTAGSASATSPARRALADARACGVLQALTDMRADVLVLLVRPRSWLSGLFHRSVTVAVLRHCHVPVLLLSAEALN